MEWFFVDDTKDDRQSFAEALSLGDDLRVSAISGGEAREKLASRSLNPDGILMDIDLSNETGLADNGLALTAGIRAAQNRNDIASFPIVRFSYRARVAENIGHDPSSEDYFDLAIDKDGLSAPGVTLEVQNKLRGTAEVYRRFPETKRTAEFIRTQKSNFEKQWQDERLISARSLPLPRPRSQALHPVGCEISDCFLSFKFQLSTDEKPEKPLKYADFQVRIAGNLLTEDSIIQLEDHWRVDADVDYIEKKGSKQSIKEAREPHPSFHFQRGGHAQDQFVEQDGFVPSVHTRLGAGDWKALMQYPGPRIPALPFDPILVIDFCLAQNDGPLWKRLRNNPEYLSLVKATQNELWKPFIEGLAAPAARKKWLGPLVLF